MFFKIDNCDKKINSDLPILRLGKVNQLMRSDIYESDNEYIINIDVPGFSKEDIKIMVDGEYLEVVGTRYNPYDDDKYMHEERFFGTTTRKFYIGNIKKEKISAKLLNGVLELHIPKSCEDSKDTEYVEIK